MARRRRVTLGRALALLLLGIAVGVSLFLLRHLRKDAIDRQFRDALERELATDYELDDILFDVNRGIEVVGLRIKYPDGELAVGIERMGLTISHQDLLAGRVNVTQVDLHGLVLRLRPEDGGGPGLPGVFKPPSAEPAEGPPARPPLLRILPGSVGSRVELARLPQLARGETVRLDIERFEGHPDGPLYTATARLGAPRVRSVDVRFRFDPRTNDLRLWTDVEAFRWTREDVDRLSADVRAKLPPVEAGGVADISLRGAFVLDPFQTASLEADVDVRGLHGAFGNLHTGEAKGLPFGFRAGGGRVQLRDGVLALEDFSAEYVAPSGDIGHLGIDLVADFRRVEPHVDLEIDARDMVLTTDDMRDLLDPAVVEPVVNQFQPRGRVDFFFTMSERPAIPARYRLDLTMRGVDGVYAGRLDELTGRRYGFLYPVENCRGRITVENDIPTAFGPAERIVIHGLTGSNRTARPPAGDPERVEVRARGSVLVYYFPEDDPREDVDIEIEIDDLPIDAKLARAFSAAPSGMPYDGFNLTGWARSVKIDVERDAMRDPVPRVAYDIRLDDCAIEYEQFPLALRGIAGRIHSADLPRGPDDLERRLLEFHLSGESADGGLVQGSGTIRQSGAEGTYRFDLRSPDLHAGPALRHALGAAPGVPDQLVRLWDRLKPEGELGVNVVLVSGREPRVDLELNGACRLRGYANRGLEIEGLLGGLEYRSGLVTVNDLRGAANEASFRASGTIQADGAFVLAGRIDRLHLHRPVRELLRETAPDAARAIRALELESRSELDVELNVERRGPDAPIRAHARLERLALLSRIDGLEILIGGGPVEVTPEAVVARDLVLADGAAEVYIHEADLPRGGRRRGWIEFDARDLESRRHLRRLFGERAAEVFGDNLRVDLTDFEVELHRAAGNAVLRGRVDLRRHEVRERAPDVLEPTGAFVLTPLTLRLPGENGRARYHGIVQFRHLNLRLPVPVHDMRGELRIADGTFAPFSCHGAVFEGRVTAYDRVFDNLSLNLLIDPEFVRLNNIDGRLYEGRLRGDIDVHQRDPDAFRLRLDATSVQLASMFEKELSRDNPMTGLIDARLEIESRTGEPRDLRGGGTLRVRDGQLFKIPGLRSILAVLGPATALDGPRFERAEAEFRIRGETIHVDRYHLSTRINDVKGSGTISIYGDLDLVVDPQVPRLIDVPRLLDIPFLSVLRNLWHRAVYEFRLQGTLRSPDLRIRALPFLKRSRRRLPQSAHAGSVRRIRPGIVPR